MDSGELIATLSTGIEAEKNPKATEKVARSVAIMQPKLQPTTSREIEQAVAELVPMVPDKRVPYSDASAKHAAGLTGAKPCVQRFPRYAESLGDLSCRMAAFDCRTAA
jgi:hypothetical protein